MESQKKILVAGSFEILHPGHIEFFKFAKSLGEKLVVIVATDKNFEKFKKRKPIIPENQRLFLVQNIKFVDGAILGDENDFFESVQKIKPDIIVLGYDQISFGKEDLKRKILESGLKIKIMRAPKFEDFDLNKTGKIIEKIKSINFEA